MYLSVLGARNLSFTSFQAQNMCFVEKDPEKGTSLLEDAGSEQSDQVKNANIRILLYMGSCCVTYIYKKKSFQKLQNHTKSYYEHPWMAIFDISLNKLILLIMLRFQSLLRNTSGFICQNMYIVFTH